MSKVTVNISTRSHQQSLSKAQQTFNKLIKQIEQGRATLAEWEALRGPYQQKFSTQLTPLLKDAEEIQIQIVHALDAASAKLGFSKRERSDITGVIIDMVQGLLATRDDEALKAIFNKHSGVSYSEIEAEGQAEAKAMLKEAFGIELDGDVDLRSPESVLERLQEKLQKEEARQEAAAQAREERQAKRKKSPRQLAREAQEEANEQQLRLSIREIYRKLASTLHPDREPDPQERARKTALMQRVNQAYEKNNLLQLLELQLELEHIDQAALHNVSEERLKHYNQILREQFDELRHEIMRAEGAFMFQAGLDPDPFHAATPKAAMKALTAEIANAQRDIRQLKNDLKALETVPTLKAWIKRSRMAMERESRFGFPF